MATHAERRGWWVLACLVGVLACLSGTLEAHGVSRRDADFVQSLNGPAIVPFLYLGAKHMVTGYDHLLFLVGVVFFLYRLKDVVAYVTMFTIGHSVTLLAGVLGDVHVNAHLIDAVIGLSVVYKGFENIGGFDAVFGLRPNGRAVVCVFGLFHGLGLATKLQDLGLPRAGLLTNLVSFNIGVELGQVLALTFVLFGLTTWRRRPGFAASAFATNTALMTGGFLLVGYQLTGYLVTR